jgi:hypothetical protein
VRGQGGAAKLNSDCRLRWLLGEVGHGVEWAGNNDEEGMGRVG